eukprot:COSAG02_NODE_56923_length_283_cov_0.630435_1_plen_30_part_01
MGSIKQQYGDYSWRVRSGCQWSAMPEAQGV